MWCFSTLDEVGINSILRVACRPKTRVALKREQEEMCSHSADSCTNRKSGPAARWQFCRKGTGVGNIIPLLEWQSLYWDVSGEKQPQRRGK